MEPTVGGPLEKPSPSVVFPWFSGLPHTSGNSELPPGGGGTRGAEPALLGGAG